MPEPDKMLMILRRAILAFRATPGRQGRLVHLSASGNLGGDVFVTGDLHGNLDNFRRLYQLANLAAHPTRHLVFQEVIHSAFTYPDGTDKSHLLLDLLAALKTQYPDRVHFLLGNHELAQLTQVPVGKRDTDLNFQFEQGVKSAYGSRAAEIYAAYLQLLANVPVALRTDNRIYLSHSLPDGRRLDRFQPEDLEHEPSLPADLLVGGSIHSLVWGRDIRVENATAFLSRVDADLLITGHMPCDEGFEVPNDRQIILDSQKLPAGYLLFPLGQPLTHGDLVARIRTLTTASTPTT